MTQNKPILIASDHAGNALKTAIQKHLPEWKWMDIGPFEEKRVDYPDFAQLLSQKIHQGEAELGILICGSGIGMSIAANKMPGIRAALVDNESAARLSKEHNNANVLCLGSRFVAPEYGVEIVKSWLETPFSEEPRHQQRLEKIRSLENQSQTSSNTPSNIKDS
jgi:ribose 5-phosphate isomerase B